MSKRGTGRTTRMIEWAKCLENEGKAIYIVVDNRSLALDIKSRLPKGTSIKVETPDSIGGFWQFDWNSMRGWGMHPNCRVLFDHYTIERRIAPLLEELHRYD